MKYTLLLSSLIFLAPPLHTRQRSIDQYAYSNYALVCVPIADVTSEALCDLLKTNHPETVYRNIPYTPEKGGAIACLRAHQLLFNEIVSIEEERGAEVRIKILNAFYDDPKNNKTHASFWTLKSFLFPIDMIDQEYRAAIPLPYTDMHGVINLTHILTLQMPWHDRIQNVTYSARTRFVRATQHDTEYDYAVYLLNIVPDAQAPVRIAYIPKQRAIIDYPLGYRATRDMFLDILYRWADKRGGVIPTVWGGCSVGTRMPEHAFQLVYRYIAGRETAGWERPDAPLPKYGCDASGLVLCALQICGAPYFYKNTITAKNNLRAIGARESIEAGDILWIPGQIVVFGDEYRQEMIEAVSYSSGYGCIHALPIQKMFKDICSFEQLRQVIRAQQPLERLDVHGNVIRTISECSILKLRSLWR